MLLLPPGAAAGFFHLRGFSPGSPILSFATGPLARQLFSAAVLLLEEIGLLRDSVCPGASRPPATSVSPVLPPRLSPDMLWCLTLWGL